MEAEKRKKEEDEASRVALDAKRHHQELAGTRLQQKMISASKRDKAMQRKAAAKRLMQDAKNEAEFTRHMAAIKAKQNVAKVRWGVEGLGFCRMRRRMGGGIFGGLRF